jgi:hypothetical protein
LKVQRKSGEISAKTWKISQFKTSFQVKFPEITYKIYKLDHQLKKGDTTTPYYTYSSEKRIQPMPSRYNTNV